LKPAQAGFVLFFSTMVCQPLYFFFHLSIFLFVCLPLYFFFYSSILLASFFSLNINLSASFPICLSSSLFLF
jgi:hypothetical protein